MVSGVGTTISKSLDASNCGQQLQAAEALCRGLLWEARGWREALWGHSRWILVAGHPEFPVLRPPVVLLCAGASGLAGAGAESVGRSLAPAGKGEGTQDTGSEPLFGGGSFSNAASGRMDLHALLESAHRIGGPLYKTAEQVIMSV
jgi:hypothetical protein